MLEMCFFETNIPRPPQASVPSRLREGSFNACPSMIGLLKLLRLLTHTRRLQEFMTLLRKAQRHAAPRLLGIGALFPDRTCLTDLFGKEDLDDRLSLRVLVQILGTALLPLRAGDSLPLPVDVEVLDIQCARSASLPTRINMDWPHQINPVGFPTVQDPLGADIASIDELLGWKKLFGG